MIYSYEKNIIIASVNGLVEPVPCHFDLIQDNFILFYENKDNIKLFSLNEPGCEEYFKSSSRIQLAKLIKQHKYLITIIDSYLYKGKIQIWDYFNKTLNFTIKLNETNKRYSYSNYWNINYFLEKNLLLINYCGIDLEKYEIFENNEI